MVLDFFSPYVYSTVPWDGWRMSESWVKDGDAGGDGWRMDGECVKDCWKMVTQVGMCEGWMKDGWRMSGLNCFCKWSYTVLGFNYRAMTRSSTTLIVIFSPHAFPLPHAHTHAHAHSHTNTCKHARTPTPTQEIPRRLRVYLPLFIDLLGESDMERDGVVIPHEIVRKEVLKNTLGFSISLSDRCFLREMETHFNSQTDRQTGRQTDEKRMYRRTWQ